MTYRKLVFCHVELWHLVCGVDTKVPQLHSPKLNDFLVYKVKIRMYMKPNTKRISIINYYIEAKLIKTKDRKLIVPLKFCVFRVELSDLAV